MSKEQFNKIIGKMGTFRGKKTAHNQRPSTSDLKYPDFGNESMFKMPASVDDYPSSYPNESELDTTCKSFNMTMNSYRASNQTLTSNFPTPTFSIYDTMSDEQINEEFERSVLNVLNLKSDKDIEKMRELPIEKKKNLIVNMRKNTETNDDKADTLAALLKERVKESRNLKENLKQLSKVLKRISLCISHKPIR
jgi:hypothetical protein